MNAVRNCALGNLDAELHQFSVDAACTQEEFAVAIFLTSAAVSVVTGGQPPDRRGPVVATSAVGAWVAAPRRARAATYASNRTGA